MNIDDVILAVKESENDQEVVYAYGHVNNNVGMTGTLKITNFENPSISTIKLENGYKTRANEIRIGGQIIIQFFTNGVWPEKAMV